MAGTLIVTYGNPLRGDDGAGWRVAELLRAQALHSSVRILTLQQLTPELMEDLSQADRAVFVDAAQGGLPGEVRKRALEASGCGSTFHHFASPEALLRGALRLYGRAPQAWLITVTGGDFSLSERLSPPVEASLPVVVENVLQLLP